MTTDYPTPKNATPATWVAIDVAKDAHAVLVEGASGRRRLRVANTLDEITRLVTFLQAQPAPVRFAFVFGPAILPQGAKTAKV